MTASTFAADATFYLGTYTRSAKSKGIYVGKLNQAGYYWVGNTSRDQYSGAMFGLGVAYDMVDDPLVRTEAAALITRLVDFLAEEFEKQHGTDPRADPESLAFLYQAAEQAKHALSARHATRVMVAPRLVIRSTKASAARSMSVTRFSRSSMFMGSVTRAGAHACSSRRRSVTESRPLTFTCKPATSRVMRILATLAN